MRHSEPTLKDNANFSDCLTPFGDWRPIETAPKDGTPVLVLLSPGETAKRDGWHGPAQVAAHRGRGWISIPGMWHCHPTHWASIPPLPRATPAHPVHGRDGR